jgi:hypothetical protein
MITERDLKAGTRVRLRGEPIGLTLRGTTGRIVRRDDLEGFAIIRLDQAALCDDAPGVIVRKILRS